MGGCVHYNGLHFSLSRLRVRLAISLRSRRRPFNINIKILKIRYRVFVEHMAHVVFKLRVGEKTKRTNREDYCSPKKVQLSSKPPTSRLRKKRSRKFSRSYDAERSVRPAYPYIGAM